MDTSLIPYMAAFIEEKRIEMSIYPSHSNYNRNHNSGYQGKTGGHSTKQPIRESKSDVSYQSNLNGTKSNLMNYIEKVPLKRMGKGEDNSEHSTNKSHKSGVHPNSKKPREDTKEGKNGAKSEKHGQTNPQHK